MEQSNASSSRAAFTDAMSRQVFKALQTISKRGEPLTPEMLAELLLQDPNYRSALEKTIQDRVDSVESPPLEKEIPPLEKEMLLEQIQTLTQERDEALESVKKFKRDLLRQGAEDMDEFSEARICPRRFRHLLVSFLNLVRMDMPSGAQIEVDALIQQASEGENSTVLSQVAERILDMVEARLEIVHDERRKNTEFLQAVDQNLLAIQGHVLDSHNEVQEVHDGNKVFYGDITGRMADMSQSVSASSSLKSLQEVLLEKMQHIKDAIEEKHAQDVKRMNKANARMEKLKTSLKTLIRQVSEVRSKARILEKQAMVDPLTEIPNRRAYEAKLAEEWARFKRYGAAFSMLLVDLDHFKGINDEFGHAVGDKCLQGVVGLMRPNLRSTDFLARFGGEEFVVILPDTGREGACQVGEKLRKKVENANFMYEGEKIKVTISVGGTEAAPGDKGPEGVFDRLDAAMYQAKDAGRNRLAWLPA